MGPVSAPSKLTSVGPIADRATNEAVSQRPDDVHEPKPEEFRTSFDRERAARHALAPRMTHDHNVGSLPDPLPRKMRWKLLTHIRRSMPTTLGKKLSSSRIQ